MSEKEIKQNQKASLLEELLAVQVVQEELWLYHPNNPDKKDIVKEYDVLKKIQTQIEKEIKDLN